MRLTIDCDILYVDIRILFQQWNSVPMELCLLLRVCSFPIFDCIHQKRLSWSCFVIANDKLVKIWSPNTGEFIHGLIGHTKGNSDISWSSDSVYLASASDDRTIKIWDVDSVRPYFFLHHGLSLKLESRELHPVFWKGTEIRYFVLTTNTTSTLIVSGCLDGDIKIWDAAKGEHRKKSYTMRVLSLLNHSQMFENDQWSFRLRDCRTL